MPALNPQILPTQNLYPISVIEKLFEILRTVNESAHPAFDRLHLSERQLGSLDINSEIKRAIAGRILHQTGVTNNETAGLC